MKNIYPITAKYTLLSTRPEKFSKMFCHRINIINSQGTVIISYIMPNTNNIKIDITNKKNFIKFENP